MLRKLVCGFLLSGIFFGCANAGTAFPDASQEWLDALNKRNNAINSVSEICGGEERYDYINDKVLISRVNKILDKHTYDYIKTIRSRLYKLEIDAEDKRIPLYYEGNIKKYNQKYIPKDLYDKGFDFLSSNYKYGDDEINYILAAGCNPFVLLGFKGPNDDNFFAEEKDYKRYKLILGLRAIVGNYLKENFFSYKNHIVDFTLYSEAGKYLGEKTHVNGGRVYFGDYFISEKEYYSIIDDDIVGKRIDTLLGREFLKNISGQYRTKKIINTSDITEDQEVLCKIFPSDPSCPDGYKYTDMNFTLKYKLQFKN